MVIILQYCDGFGHTSTWIATGIHVSLPSWNPLPHPSPHYPSGLSQSTGSPCRALLRAWNLHRSSILHMVMNSAFMIFISLGNVKNLYLSWTEHRCLHVQATHYTLSLLRTILKNTGSLLIFFYCSKNFFLKNKEILCFPLCSVEFSTVIEGQCCCC